MLSKIYFPRLIIPLTSVLGRLIDLAISFAAAVRVDGLVSDHATDAGWSLLVPLLTLADNDDRLGLGHVAERAGASSIATSGTACRSPCSFLMYAAPVVYPTSLIPSSVSIRLRAQSDGRRHRRISGVRLLGSRRFPGT